MMVPPPRYLVVWLAVAMAGWPAHGQARDNNPRADSGPRLINTCLITENLNRLVEFYEPVLELKARRAGPDYAEFHTGVGVLAVFSAAAQEKYISWLGRGGEEQERNIAVQGLRRR